MSDNRISHLDGLRGVAVVIVVFFHAYSQWNSIEPFTQHEFLSRAFVHAWLGVYLFFAISGYVIYMTLLRSQNIFMFGISRYLRLMPAMLVASLFIYAASFFTPERPSGPVGFLDLLTSITFVDPQFINKATGLTLNSLDSAFWSLYVEVQFYILAAILFFAFKDKQLYGLVVLYVTYFTAYVLSTNGIGGPPIERIYELLLYARVKYFAWFLIGIYAFKYLQEKNNSKLLAIAFFAVLGTIQLLMEEGYSNSLLISIIATALVFVLPMFSPMLRTLLSSKILLFFGSISYALYLLHQNIVTGFAIKLHQSGIELPAFAYPLPFMILVTILSIFVTRLEPRIKKCILNWLPYSIFGKDIKRRPINKTDGVFT